jgi:8-hydroxy-5-deazaflavin:NADPH oxidoreductase
MKISIIGSGNIGGNLARLFIKAGYDVALANSRGPSSLNSFVSELGGKLHPTDVDGAVAYGDIVVVSIYWRALDSLPVFKVPGKIIVDTTNPYKVDGTFYDLGDDISSSVVIKHFPGGSVVKAFNTIWFKHLAETGNLKLPPEERRVIPIAGDDKSAKEKIGKIIEEIGFGPLDTGTLRDGSKLQGVQGILYNRELTVKAARMMIKNAIITK